SKKVSLGPYKSYRHDPRELASTEVPRRLAQRVYSESEALAYVRSGLFRLHGRLGAAFTTKTQSRQTRRESNSGCLLSGTVSPSCGVVQSREQTAAGYRTEGLSDLLPLRPCREARHPLAPAGSSSERQPGWRRHNGQILCDP